MTRFDEIRQKSPEELAEWLNYGFLLAEFCDPERPGAGNCQEPGRECCKTCILRYLTEETETSPPEIRAEQPQEDET